MRTVGSDLFTGLRFTRSRQFSDVTVVVEQTGDFSAWNPGAITESITLQSDGTEWIHARSSVAASSVATQFLRLKATLAPAPAPLRLEPRLAPKTRRPTLTARP